MEILKIIVSTIILAIVSALVFFALYFFFPTLSYSWFGVSARQPEFVSSPGMEDVSYEEKEEDQVYSEPERKIAGHSSHEEEIDTFLSSSEGKTAMKAISIDVENLSDEEKSSLISSLSSLIEETGESLSTLFSGSEIRKHLSGEVSEAFSSVISSFKGA